MAIEHGSSRCPRCMALAEYTFLERGDNKLEYQVQCGTCHHVHTEVTVVSHTVTAAA